MLATRIIAISKNVEDILINWDHASERKVDLIHHGFDFNYFQSISVQRIGGLLSKYNISKENSYPIIGVISRYVQWKGIQYIVPAFKKILEQHSSAKLILANAHGEYESEVKALLQTLPNDSYLEIKFEDDLAALYKLFDIYVHVPIDRHVEAFGQTYIESIIAGIPSIVTLSGIANEFIEHKRNAWVVDFKNIDQIVNGINEILINRPLRERFRRQREESIKRFSLESYIASLEKLYNKSK
jgi:glycosyltransferase involved in cell wall biosynthesis